MTASPAANPRGVRLPRRARRAQLLGAAHDVFVAAGYHAAAMDDIAERAGISKPVLYQHFPSKLDLYLALLDQHTEVLMAAIGEALASTTDNKQRVAATIQAYFDFVDDTGGAFRIVFESDLTNEAAVRDRVDRMTYAVAEATGAVIAEDTGLPRDEAMLLAVGLSGLAQVTARWWVTSQGAIPRDAAARLVANLAWRGIRGFPRTTDQVPDPTAG